MIVPMCMKQVKTLKITIGIETQLLVSTNKKHISCATTTDSMRSKQTTDALHFANSQRDLAQKQRQHRTKHLRTAFLSQKSPTWKTQPQISRCRVNLVPNHA
ncbi:hypothetical protein T10_7431 [Trichinella papuae]|uniref:Uncharacterized protein n=1 Tax=Trichinella papuae TaxID=268474 RepID=A0A0V1M7J4_9BILA|nr:hypothetical protein T10_7431 [Trichinella papuae]